MAPRLVRQSRGSFYRPTQLDAGNGIHRRSAMLRWQASAKATSRMPAVKSAGIGACVATCRKNRSQPTRYGLPVGVDGEAAFFDDRNQRIRQMLGRADAPGGAIDDDADRLGRHCAIPVGRMG